MKDMITIAVAGLGSRGNAYASALASFADRAKIVACADILPDRVERFGDKYGVMADARFQSAEEMLEAPRLADVMIIATPDRLHFSQAASALDKSYHLLLEKPVSPILSECFELAKKALADGNAYDKILSLGWSDKIVKVKYDIPNDKPEMFEQYTQQMTADFDGLTEVA